MSHEATNWAFKLKLPPFQKMVLLALANCHNPAHGCFPSQEYISQVACMSRRTVHTHLVKLEEAGLITRVSKRNEKQQWLATEYVLHFAKGHVQDLHKGDQTHVQMTTDPCANDSKTHVQHLHTKEVKINSKRNSNTPHTPQGGKRVSVRSILLEVFNEEDSQALIDHRKAVKAPLTVRSAQLLMKKMARVPDPIEALNLVIEKGWRGFEPEWLEKHKQSKEDDRVKSQFGQFQSPGSHFILKQYLDADKPNSPPPPQMKGLSYEH